jgi:hypothetical protein
MSEFKKNLMSPGSSKPGILLRPRFASSCTCRPHVRACALRPVLVLAYVELTNRGVHAIDDQAHFVPD